MQSIRWACPNPTERHHLAVDMKLWVVAILDLSEVKAVMVDMEIILGGTVDILEAEAMVDTRADMCNMLADLDIMVVDLDSMVVDSAPCFRSLKALSSPSCKGGVGDTKEVICHRQLNTHPHSV